MKELKGAELLEKIVTMYRFKSKSSKYIWLDVLGKKCEIPLGKKIKCFLLVGRMRDLTELPHRILLDNSLILNSTSSDLWMKISYQGLILFISNSESWNPFGISNSSLYATKIYEYLNAKSSIAFRNAIKTSTVFSPIVISVTTNSGAIIPLIIHPHPSIIYIRLKVTHSLDDGVQVSVNALYPATSLDTDIYLPLSADTSMGHQFELCKLEVSKNAFLQDIERTDFVRENL